MYKWVLGFLLSLPVWGASVCPGLLTTSFGYQGPLIAGLQPNGRLTILQDTYSAGHTPAFSIATTSIALPFQRPLHSLSSVPDSEKAGGFLASVSTQGELTLILPDGRAIPAFLPGQHPVRSASLYRVPVREIERHWVTLKGMRFQPTEGMYPERQQRRIKPRTQFSERYSVIQLFFTSERSIFRVSLRYRDLTAEDKRLRDALAGGMAFAETENDEDTYGDWRPNREHLVDLSMLGANTELLIATGNPDQVVTVSNFQEVFQLPQSSLMTEIDYIQALSQNELVAGSETGEVVRIDLEKQAVTQTLAFPTPVFLTSFSAHRSEGHLEIWAVAAGAAGPALFKYESTYLSSAFKAVEDFPKGVSPKQVASFGSPLPTTYQPRNRGYLSRIHGGLNGAEVEEVLVLGTDGSLVALRDQVGCVEIECKQEWQRFPFLQTAN